MDMGFIINVRRILSHQTPSDFEGTEQSPGCLESVPSEI